MYSIRELIKTFEAHAKEAEVNQENMRKRFRENNPEEPFPDYMNDTFSLPAALVSICKAIKNHDETLYGYE